MFVYISNWGTVSITGTKPDEIGLYFTTEYYGVFEVINEELFFLKVIEHAIIFQIEPNPRKRTTIMKVPFR